MEDFGNLAGLINGFQRSGDMSSHMFSVVDEVSDSFKEQFEMAKSGQSKKPNNGGVQKAKDNGEQEAQAKEKVEETAAADDEQAKAVNADEEVAVDEELEAVVAEATLLLESEVDGEEVADIDGVVEQEAVIDVEADVVVEEVITEEVADEAEVVADIDGALVEEVVVEEQEVADIEGAVNAEEVADIDGLVEQDQLADVDQVEVEVAVEEVEEVADADVVEGVEDLEVDLEAEEAQIVPLPVNPEQHVTAEEIVVDEEAPAVRIQVPKQQVQQQIQRPEVAQVQADDVQLPAEEMTLRQEASVEGDNHNITHKADKLKIDIPVEQREQITRGLADIANRMQVQAPQANLVSEKVIQGLKATNSQLAQQLEAGRATSAQVRPQAPAAAPQAKAAAPQPVLQEAQQSSAAEKSEAPQRSRLEGLKERILDQVKIRMRTFNQGRMGEVNIRLKPQYLGNIKIVLNVEDMHAHARFVVENNSVRELLQNSSGDLQKSLQDAGLDVSDINVDVSQDGGEFEGGNGAFASIEEQQAARQWIRSFFGARADTEELEATVDVVEEGDDEEVLNVIA